MYKRLKSAITQLPIELQPLVDSLIQSPTFDATISPDDFKQWQQLTKTDPQTLLLQLLPLAASLALVPISNFYVGAIARGGSGRLYFGANMEFANVQLNQSVHAEQSAIAHAWLKGETQITDFTINYSPCGHCRQFINELSDAQNIKIQLPNQANRPFPDYLPNAFGPSDLGDVLPLLSPVDHQISYDGADPLLQRAIDATNESHAPYTKNYSGVAIQLKDQRCFIGRYAENAAFNPSLPPLQVALISMNLADVSLDAIEEVVLFESSQNAMSHYQTTKNLLVGISPKIRLRHVTYPRQV